LLPVEPLDEPELLDLLEEPPLYDPLELPLLLPAANAVLIVPNTITSTSNIINNFFIAFPPILHFTFFLIQFEDVTIGNFSA
jgi:hypothetical protein